MPSWGDLLGKGSVAEQLLVWGVLNQLVGELLGPELELVRDNINALTPVVPLSPDQLAELVVRGVKAEGDMAGEAAKSGINPDRFSQLVHLAGEPIGLEQGLEAVRRGFMPAGDAGVDAPSLERLVKTGRYYDYWLPVIEKLAEVPLSVGEAVNAALRGQAPTEQMAAEAYANGVTAERFQVLIDSAGRPPSPTELIEMVRRGKIPAAGAGPDVLSLEQGIKEGDTKNKWLPVWQELLRAVPPPRTVTTLLRTGAIDQAQAHDYFVDAGLDATAAAAYVKSVTGDKLAGSKELQQSTVLELFGAGAIDQAQAVGMLGKLGYSPAQATFLLELAELRRETSALNRAISRVGTLYTTSRITRAGATEALGELGVTGTHQQRLMATWDTEKVSEVKLPTISEIGGALKYGAITEDEAMSEAAKLGYQPFDAYVALSAHSNGAVTVKPADRVTGPGVI